jgi:hypothetical protein
VSLCLRSLFSQPQEGDHKEDMPQKILDYAQVKEENSKRRTHNYSSSSAIR